MGNSNGRGDGLGSPAEIDEDGGGYGAVDNNELLDAPLPPPPEAMGHSPPYSPRATQSPLMFTPQSPVAPLEKKDDSNHLRISPTSFDYDEMDSGEVIPIMITWSYGGNEVFVEGSWDNWRTRTPLHCSGKEFTIMKVLPSGVYQYKFLVDGQWKHAPDFPWSQDDSAAPYNILDLQDYVPEDLESISNFERPQSPESSYNNLFLGSEDYAKDPPMVPPHLQMTLLNLPCLSVEIAALKPRPQHVVLNHLYMQKGKNSSTVLGLGSTQRFLTKYVTVVLYKSLER